MSEAPPPVVSQPTPQKKGLAIASLVCGLLFFCAPISSVAALVCGLLYLLKKPKAQEGRGMAIAGVVLGGVFSLIGGIGILAGILIPVLTSAKMAANTTQCVINLKQIGLAIRIHVDREGKAPADLETLVKTNDAPDLQLFLCKCCGEKPDGSFKTRYVYRMPPQDGAGGWSPTLIVAYDDTPCHAVGRQKGRAVLFADGSARFVPEEGFQTLLADSPVVPEANPVPQDVTDPEVPEGDADAWKKFNGEALAFYEQGRYDQGVEAAKKAVQAAEKVRGPEHPDVATSLNNLGLLYDAQGQYAQAELLYKRSLAIWEKALGPEHADVATCLSNLADLYRTQGQYAEAEPLFKRSLEIREKILGPEHSDVAISLNNLALSFNAQGRHAEAEPLFQRALAIWEKEFGPDHPNVATCLNNLGMLHEAQGQHAEAEPLFQRSLEIREKVLDPEHPHVALSLHNLACLYNAQGRHAEAEPLFKRALAIWEAALGPTHPNVAASLSNLAALYRKTDRAGEAEALESRAAAIQALQR